MSSKYTWLFDAGHGGMVGGEYVTPGKRSPALPDGTSLLYEGVFNRAVRAKLVAMFDGTGISHQLVTYDRLDVPLQDRVERINTLHRVHKNCVLVSIHGNAGGGTGFEVFTSPGDTPADPIATVFCEEIIKEFPSRAFRPDHSDGDPDKEAMFYVLTQTDCPAILTENLFMDRPADCEFMLTKEGQQRIALAHFNAIKRIEGIPV